MCSESTVVPRFWRPWEEPPEETSSSGEDLPREKRRRRSSLSVKEKQEIFDLHRYFIAEGYPYPVREVSNVLKYHRSMIHRVLRDGVRSPSKKGPKNTKFSKIDQHTQEVIRQMVYRRYGGNQVSSINLLLEQVKEELPDFPYERTHLYTLLKKMGFVFEKNRNKTACGPGRRQTAQPPSAV